LKEFAFCENLFVFKLVAENFSTIVKWLVFLYIFQKNLKIKNPRKLHFSIVKTILDFNFEKKIKIIFFFTASWYQSLHKNAKKTQFNFCVHSWYLPTFGLVFDQNFPKIFKVQI